jgi:hypothetical protein
MVQHRSREALRISGVFWPRATFRRVIPFCSPGLETSVKLARPTDLLAMIIEPPLTILLEALEIYELGS